jgi:hypothetical protein
MRDRLPVAWHTRGESSYASGERILTNATSLR